MGSCSFSETIRVYFYADLHGCRKHPVDTGDQAYCITQLDRMMKVYLIDRSRHTYPVVVLGCGHGSTNIYPVHELSAQQIPQLICMIGQDQFSHCNNGICSFLSFNFHKQDQPFLFRDSCSFFISATLPSEGYFCKNEYISFSAFPFSLSCTKTLILLYCAGAAYLES